MYDHKNSHALAHSLVSSHSLALLTHFCLTPSHRLPDVDQPSGPTSANLIVRQLGKKKKKKALFCLALLAILIWPLSKQSGFLDTSPFFSSSRSPPWSHSFS